MLYLRNARFIDSRTLRISEGHLEVAPGAQGCVRFIRSIPRGARALECAGRLVTRSFVAAHHHIYSTLARGMPPPSAQPKDFVQILKLIWWNLDRKLDAPMIRASARVAAVEAARCGTTFIIDHHSSPGAPEGSLLAIAEAFEEVGLSHLLCYELSDRDGPEPLSRAFIETDRYLGGRQGLVGLHASFTVSDALLGRAAGLARKRRTGLHVHVAEAASDETHCERVHGMRVLERFSRAGVLDFPSTLLAHGIHLGSRERAIFRKSRAWLVQNPESNQNNDVGNLDPAGLGDRILLGTDGMHSDMLSSLKAAYLAGQANGGLSPLKAYRRLRRSHDYLSRNGFEGDGPNNLVVLNYPSPTPVTAGNWPAHVVYGLSRAHVESVVSRGRLIVDRGRLTTVREDEVYEEARNQAARLWRRL